MFDETRGVRKKIAIVGAGISGLSAAYYRSESHDVTLYEAEPRLGGHARTVMAGRNGDQPVDTGFIVFNYATYPYLTKLFGELDVPVIKSEMSFGATLYGGRIEYGLSGLGALVAQRRNMLRPGFYRLVSDILKFINRADTAEITPDMTIGELMDGMQLGDWFRRYYLLPISGAIWSTPPDQILDFPAETLVSFFRNHALLQYSGQHQWWTVNGGSIEYVTRLERHLRAMGVTFRMGAPVQKVVRDETGVSVHIAGQDAIRADDVIMACHSDDALRLLHRPTTVETQALSNIRYQDNRAVRHADPAVMPRRRNGGASWVYSTDRARQEDPVGVTYWMKSLQPIPQDDLLLGSLNPTRELREELIYDETTFRHPVFDRAALDAQPKLRQIQGRNNTWYCGAYMRNGFHEDGYSSAVDVAGDMGMISEWA